MTINQAHQYIKIELDKTSSLTLPAFVEEEIDYWIDDTILSLIKTKYSGNNYLKLSFEETQKRTDDLRTLVVTQDLTPTAGSSPYGVNSSLYSLSPASDYLISVNERVAIIILGVTKTVPITPTTHDQVNTKMRDPFSEHNLRLGHAEPLRLFMGNNIALIGDNTYTLSDMTLTYIKEPTKVMGMGASARAADYTDLTDSFMQEVVKNTANKMLENIESPRYQTDSLEVSKIE